MRLLPLVLVFIFLHNKYYHYMPRRMSLWIAAPSFLGLAMTYFVIARERILASAPCA